MADINNLGKIIAVTGHYGSGKTNLAVNLAVDFAKEGERVTIIDLDIVNPYFRTADFSELFGSLGIKLVAPYTNWLNYYVFQDTPYDLSRLEALEK